MGPQADRDTDRGSFGTLLRSLRGAASLSQEELAERAGLTTHAISALERGTRTRPYPHTIRALADALDASAAQRSELIAAVPGRARSATGPQGDASDVEVTGGLPVPATPLVARETEIREVGAMLQDRTQRLVTLTGTGGVGKTRVATAVAASAAIIDTFHDGVVFVELAPLLDATAVLPAIADAVDAGKPDGQDAEAVIVASVGTRQLLLVLDNFEHLLAAAPMVARLVGACPQLTVLVSSRAVLRVRGESEYAVQPLALPPDVETDHHAVERSPSGALFLERARAVRPGVGIEPADANAVAGICRRLAGIPLALELAAARTRFLDPPDLLARLDEALTGDGARDLPERQRTMTAAVDWSYRLLDDPAKAVLRLMSVFRGGFTLADLEGVADAAGTVQRRDVLRVLAALVEQSLVVLATGPGPRRYSLLEPIAQYARTMLDAAEETSVVEDAHVEYYSHLTELAAPQFQRAQQVEWLDRVDAEHANMSAAITHAMSTGAYEVVARMGWALREYWWLRGHVLHGRRAMELVLEQELSDRVRNGAEITAATMAFALNDIEAARQGWQRSYDRSSAVGDLPAQANSLAALGVVAMATGDLELARARLQESIPLAEAAGAEGQWVDANVRVWLGAVELHLGNLDAAETSINQGMAMARRRGDRLTLYIARQTLAQIALQRGDHPLARDHLADGIRLTRDAGDLANLAYLFEALSVVEARGGAHDRVPVLIGAVQGIRESIATGHKGYSFYQPDPGLEARAADDARGRLGDDRFDDALDTGRAMSIDEAVAFAVEGTTSLG